MFLIFSPCFWGIVHPRHPDPPGAGAGRDGREPEEPVERGIAVLLGSSVRAMEGSWYGGTPSYHPMWCRFPKLGGYPYIWIVYNGKLPPFLYGGNPSHHPILDGIVPYRPTILGYPHLWKPLYCRRGRWWFLLDTNSEGFHSHVGTLWKSYQQTLRVAEYLWLYIFVVFSDIFCSFGFACFVIVLSCGFALFCHFFLIFLSFSHPARGLDPEPTWKILKRYFACTGIIFVFLLCVFFFAFFRIVFAFVCMSQIGSHCFKHLVCISQTKMTIKCKTKWHKKR